MIRLPQPPQTIGTPATPEQFARKFIDIQNYLTNLIRTLEIEQNKTQFETSAASKESEETVEAKSWFNG